jgi:hypothetical protein
MSTEMTLAGLAGKAVYIPIVFFIHRMWTSGPSFVAILLGAKTICGDIFLSQRRNLNFGKIILWEVLLAGVCESS